MRVELACDDRYEAQKLASLIFVSDGAQTNVTGIINVIGNEVVISLRDGSAHSILMRDAENVEAFADFCQSITEGIDRIVSVEVSGERVGIAKEGS